MNILSRKIFILTCLVFVFMPVLFVALQPVFAAETPECIKYKSELGKYTVIKQDNPNDSGLIAEKAAIDKLSALCTASFEANNPLPSNSVSGGQNQLQDPLTTGSSSGVNGIYIVIGRVVKYLLGTAGSVALLMFVWGGFQYLWSAGDANKIKKGKDTLINAALGIVILLTAFTIINTLISALTVSNTSATKTSYDAGAASCDNYKKAQDAWSAETSAQQNTELGPDGLMSELVKLKAACETYQAAQSSNP